MRKRRGNKNRFSDVVVRAVVSPFIEHLACTVYAVKHFMCVVSFNSHVILMR